VWSVNVAWRCGERCCLDWQAAIRGCRWASDWNVTSASSCSRTTFLQCWSWCCPGSRSGSTTRHRQPESLSVSHRSYTLLVYTVTPSVHDIMDRLHWLPIRAQIDFKIATLTYNTLTFGHPAYLELPSRINFSVSTFSLIAIRQTTSPNCSTC